MKETGTGTVELNIIEASSFQDHLQLWSKSATVNQQIFGAYLFSAIFGPVMFGAKFVAAKILFCKVQCDSVYRQQQYRLKT